jgi:hypothetical protein
MIINVISVRVLPDYQLELGFDNGETKIFNFQKYLDYKCYKMLKDVNEFNKARVSFGTISWGGNIDIAPECLYENSVKI